MLLKKYLCYLFRLRPLNKIIFNEKSLSHVDENEKIKNPKNKGGKLQLTVHVNWAQRSPEIVQQSEMGREPERTNEKWWFLKFYLWYHGHDWQAPEGRWRQYSISLFVRSFFSTYSAYSSYVVQWTYGIHIIFRTRRNAMAYYSLLWFWHFFELVVCSLSLLLLSLLCVFGCERITDLEKYVCD